MSRSTCSTVGDFNDLCQSEGEDSYLDTDRKRNAGVNPASEALQSSGNNNRGLAFDVSVVVKAETRVEINKSSLRGADPLPVARKR